MVHLILASSVLHNYWLLKDDFDEGYFLDDGDDDNYGSMEVMLVMILHPEVKMG